VQQALHYIRSQPGDWLALMGRKLVVAFNVVELVDTKDQYSHADLAFVLRATGWVFHFGVLAPLALLGVWVTWPDRARLLPVQLLFLVYTSTLLVFYMFARYRMPLLPILALFAAAGMARLPEFLRASRPSRIVACFTTTALAAAFCNWPVFDEDYMRSVTQYNLGNELVDAGRIDDAMERYRRAVSLYGDNVMAHHNLGALLANGGDLAGARAEYERALEIDPRYVQARLNLALTWNDLGLAQEARGELDRAGESFERALALDPELQPARDNLTRVREAPARNGQLREFRLSPSELP
jgi:tetratricopeptide (TPR) repeat protein